MIVLKTLYIKLRMKVRKKIKMLRSYNGGEYTSNEFTHFGKQKGIKKQLSTPYTPQQNGVGKRMYRTLQEKAKSMLKTKLHNFF